MNPRHTLTAYRRRRKRRNRRATADLFTPGQRPEWLRRMLEERAARHESAIGPVRGGKTPAGRLTWAPRDGRLFIVHNPRQP